MRGATFAGLMLAHPLAAAPALAEAAPTETAAPAQAASAQDDGWLDMSKFLDEKYGFLPIAMPITEPAVGYGAIGGVAFLSKSFGDARAGLGRPNVTFVGGGGTANGSWMLAAGDSRYWLDDHLQTLVAAVYASVNLDFHGLGKSDRFENDPLHYQLEPAGGIAQAKYRFGASSLWAGLSYSYISAQISLEDPPPSDQLAARGAKLAGLTFLGAFDSRDNIFTPTRGTYAETALGVFNDALGGTADFERIAVTALQFVTLPRRFYLGLRGEVAATFGDAPFYACPYVNMRGVAALRYLGEELAQLEAELRYQFWKRLSVVGFAGGGGVWTQLRQFDSGQGVVAGGGGFRYELARDYGIHAGIDVGGSRETAAFYVQVGSAWMRP